LGKNLFLLIESLNGRKLDFKIFTPPSRKTLKKRLLKRREVFTEPTDVNRESSNNPQPLKLSLSLRSKIFFLLFPKSVAGNRYKARKHTTELSKEMNRCRLMMSSKCMHGPEKFSYSTREEKILI
jgi:hypothetical protein